MLSYLDIEGFHAQHLLPMLEYETRLFVHCSEAKTLKIETKHLIPV